MPDLPRLSIVIAAFNEAGNIDPLLTEITALFERSDAAEIIVVDDGSADGTAVAVRAAAAADSRIRLLRHRRRAGKSATIWTGAERARGEWLATLDGDGQNDPADLLQLWRRISAAPPAPDVQLFAGRRDRRNDGPVKRLASRVGNRIRRALLRDAADDTGCGLKVVRRETFLRLPYFDNMHRFYPALICRAGGRTVEVPVADRPRRYGASKYGVFDRLGVGMFDLLGVYWLCRRATFPDIEQDI